MIEFTPACEYPGGSDVNYLFIGALWIGALVDTGGYEFPRVSVGNEGWTGPGNNNFELNPGEVGTGLLEEHGILERSCIPGALDSSGQEIYSPDAIAPQEFIAVYTDTLSEYFWTGTDIIDGPHFPLGLKVTQKAMVWDALGFEDFVLFDITIENIGTFDLKNLYLGLYVDGDVGWIEEFQYHWDDVTGFLHDYAGETWNVPYIADNDGRPKEVQSGSEFTCPGVSGIQPLLSQTDPLYISYNWWISAGNPDLDFGPSWVDDGAPGNWTDTLGTPNGDARKYFVMTNKEIDYDQWYKEDEDWIFSHPQVFTDPFTGAISVHEWRIEDYGTSPYLYGYDAKYLVSIGPFGENITGAGEEPETYLYPGDSLRFTFAYVCGENFHDPENPQSYSSLDPSKYVYDDLVYNCSKARYLYDNDLQMLLPYSPQSFHISASYDDSIRFVWDAYTTIPDVGVNVYRRMEGALYDTIPLNTLPVSDTMFVDTTVITGQGYHFRAQAVLNDSILSCYSEEISLVAGAPLAPQGLEASGLNEVVILSWDPNSEADLNRYNIYRGDTVGTFEWIGDTPGVFEHFADTTADNGVEYTYSITAVDHDGYESFFSDTTTVTPMGLYKPLLVIREWTSSTYPLEWPDSLLGEYYTQLFADIGESPDFLTPTVSSYLSSFPGLPELSNYQVVWIINDTHTSSSTAYMESRDEVLSDYLSLGGRVILSGRKIFIGSFGSTFGWFTTSSYSLETILAHYFKIDSVYATFAENLYPLGLPEFEAALPGIPDYPALQVDTSKCFTLPVIPEWTYLIDIDGMIPTDEGEILYTFESAWPDTSTLHGMAVGIRSASPTEPTAILTFPLYAMEPYDSVKALASRVLYDIRSISVGESPPPEPSLPVDYALKQNYPNPFNAQTIIEFEVPYISSINLSIYDIQGRLVATLLDRPYPEGKHRIEFDGEGLSSGIYFVRLTAGSYHETKKMVLLK